MFKIAKAIKVPPIRNPIKCIGAIQGSFSSGVSLINITQTTPLAINGRFDQLLKRDDLITIETTDGYIDYLHVNAVVKGGSTYSIYLQETTSYAFITGDSVVAYGTGLFENSSFNGTHGHWKQSDIKTVGSRNSEQSNSYFSSLVYPNKEAELKITLLEKIPPAINLRVGANILLDTYPTGTTNGLYLTLYDGEHSTISNEKINEDIITWTETAFGSNREIVSDDDLTNGSNFPYILFKIKTEYHTTFCMDDLFVEYSDDIDSMYTTGNVSWNYNTTTIKFESAHNFSVNDRVVIWGLNAENKNSFSKIVARVSSVDNQRVITVIRTTAAINLFAGAIVRKINNGYYEFEEYPEMGVAYSFYDGTSTSRFSRNKLSYVSNIVDDRDKKVTISMSFLHVSTSFLNKLFLFENWCLKGGYINFHTGSEIPELGNKCVYGKIKLSNFVKDHYSRNRISFNLDVIEA